MNKLSKNDLLLIRLCKRGDIKINMLRRAWCRDRLVSLNTMKDTDLISKLLSIYEYMSGSSCSMLSLTKSLIEELDETSIWSYYSRDQYTYHEICIFVIANHIGKCSISKVRHEYPLPAWFRHMYPEASETTT